MTEPEWLLKEMAEASSMAQPGLDIPQPKRMQIKSKNVRILTMAEMLDKDPKFAKNAFMKRRLRGPYAAYLSSRFHECNFIFIDKGKKAELELISDSCLAMNFLYVGEGSSLRLSNIVVSDSLNSVEMSMEENARVDAGFLKHKGAFAYYGQSTSAGTGSSVNSVCFWGGNGVGDVTSELRGAGSKALHLGLCTGGDKENIKLNSSVLHSANKTESNVVMKGVAQDSSSMSFSGHVGVESNGRGSKSSLEQHILLLDEDAKAEANPVLEIKNNDVECSHSAAVRQIEDEKLFYLQTRGLSRSMARTTLITGFLRSAINMVADKELRNMLKPPFMQD